MSDEKELAVLGLEYVTCLVFQGCRSTVEYQKLIKTGISAPLSRRDEPVLDKNDTADSAKKGKKDAVDDLHETGEIRTRES